jgi:hypothetical protein
VGRRRVASVSLEPEVRPLRVSLERMRSTRPQLSEKKPNRINAAKMGRDVPFITNIPSFDMQTKMHYSTVGEAGKKEGNR